jgi:tRNA threonylcarbamoyl adenosine modification protein YeaZ
MKILAWETSSARQSVCLMVEGRVLWEKHFTVPRRETGPLFSCLEEALRVAERRVDYLLAGTGPGSYNGLRAGLAAGQGLRLSLGCPFFGKSSLLGLPGSSYRVAGDARGKQFFYAEVRAGRFLEPPELRPALPEPRSEGGQSYWIGETPPTAWQPEHPRASLLAGLLWREILQGDPPRAEADPVPIYLKPAHITTPNGGFSVAAGPVRE